MSNHDQVPLSYVTSTGVLFFLSTVIHFWPTPSPPPPSWSLTSMLDTVSTAPTLEWSWGQIALACFSTTLVAGAGCWAFVGIVKHNKKWTLASLLLAVLLYLTTMSPAWHYPFAFLSSVFNGYFKPKRRTFVDYLFGWDGVFCQVEQFIWPDTQTTLFGHFVANTVIRTCAIVLSVVALSRVYDMGDSHRMELRFHSFKQMLWKGRYLIALMPSILFYLAITYPTEAMFCFKMLLLLTGTVIFLIPRILEVCVIKLEVDQLCKYKSAVIPEIADELLRNKD